MPDLRILVMCTANICRSPIAEHLLARGLTDGGLDVVVTSAGLMESGRPVDLRSSAFLSRAGIDIGDQVSSTVSPELVDQADLVIVMQAAHLRHLVADHRSAFMKVFILRELVQRMSDLGPLGSEHPREYVARLGLGRSPRDYVSTGGVFDVTDPFRGDEAHYWVVADEIEKLVAGVVDGFVGRPVRVPEAVEQEPSPRARRGFLRRSSR